MPSDMGQHANHCQVDKQYLNLADVKYGIQLKMNLPIT